MAKSRSAAPLWIAPLFLGLLFVASRPSHADWLLTRDGKTVETRGGWMVEGKLVKFTNKAGTLSSIRLDEVDLDASRTETSRRSAPPEAPPKSAPPKKKSVLVIQDADVKHADPAANALGQPGSIVLYSTSWCGYCRKARALLTELGVPFEEKDIEKSASANTEHKAKGGGSTAVPLIDFDGKILRGYSEGVLRRLVAERKRKAATTPETARTAN